jgi:hypothetical protein
MSATDQPGQKLLPFPKLAETRAERIERLLSGEKRITTAARMFDEAAYREATRIAKGER